MAGGLKKSNIKKKSQRAELMAEEKRIEQEKEQAKKDAAIRKKKNAIDTMFPLYGLIGAFLSVLFNQIGIFSLVALVLGFLGMKRNADKKDKFYYIAIADIVVGLITAVLFVLFITGVIHQ